MLRQLSLPCGHSSRNYEVQFKVQLQHGGSLFYDAAARKTRFFCRMYEDLGACTTDDHLSHPSSHLLSKTYLKQNGVLSHFGAKTKTKWRLTCHILAPKQNGCHIIVKMVSYMADSKQKSENEDQILAPKEIKSIHYLTDFYANRKQNGGHIIVGIYTFWRQKTENKMAAIL